MIRILALFIFVITVSRYFLARELSLSLLELLNI